MFLFSLSAVAFAGPLTWFFDPGVNAPLVNASCQAMLTTVRADESARAITRLREFRVAELRQPVAHPLARRQILVTDAADAKARTQLARHLRAVERWEPGARGFTLSGAPEIEAHYAKVDQMRDWLVLAMRGDAEAHQYRMALRTAVNLVGVASIPAAAAFDPLAGALLLLISSATIDVYGANHSRLVTDRVRSPFDLALSRRLEGGARGWTYASTFYPARAVLTRAISGEGDLAAGLNAQEIYDANVIQAIGAYLSPRERRLVRRVGLSIDEFLDARGPTPALTILARFGRTSTRRERKSGNFNVLTSPPGRRIEAR